MKRIVFVGALVLAAASADGRANAQAAVNVDGAFVVAATQGNNAELDAAHLVLERGKMDEALSFARTMLADHEELAARFARLVPPATAIMPERENAADRLMLARLAALPVTDMDQEYLIGQVAAHLTIVSVFTTEARQGMNPALKAFAQSELAMLEEHLQVALAAARHVSGDNPLK